MLVMVVVAVVLAFISTSVILLFLMILVCILLACLGCLLGLWLGLLPFVVLLSDGFVSADVAGLLAQDQQRVSTLHKSNESLSQHKPSPRIRGHVDGHPQPFLHSHDG